MKSNRVLVLLLAVAFGLIITVSLASADYVVIKDKRGICKVIKSAHKTSKTIAGPFKTMEEARNAEARECPTAGRVKERPSSSLGGVKERSKIRDEKVQKARELKEEKAKQKESARQTLKEQSSKQKQDSSKPKTDEKDRKTQDNPK